MAAFKHWPKLTISSLRFWKVIKKHSIWYFAPRYHFSQYSWLVHEVSHNFSLYFKPLTEEIIVLITISITRVDCLCNYHSSKLFHSRPSPIPSPFYFCLYHLHSTFFTVGIIRKKKNTIKDREGRRIRQIENYCWGDLQTHSKYKHTCSLEIVILTPKCLIYYWKNDSILQIIPSVKGNQYLLF